MNRTITLGPSDGRSGRWSAGWRTALAGPLTVLFRYVLVLIVLCGIGCLYLWQASDISQLNKKTQSLLREARDTEAANAFLMVQLAQWNSPSHIDRKADELGLVPAEMTGVIQIRGRQPEEVATQPARQKTESLIQQVTGLLSGH